MPSDRSEQVKRIYDSALRRKTAQRAGYLDEACGGDSELRREVESLLASEIQTDRVTEDSALVVAGVGPQAAEPTLPASGREIGNYRVLSMLGAGGMGEVYLARDTRLGRKVALKLLPARFTQDSERVHRFEREARAISALNHPNIVTIHEIGQVYATHFLVTEYIEGETLRQRIGSARLDLNEALDVAVQVANALAAAHEAGVVHRDIKPENIMVRRDGYVKVLDFGLAKLTEASAQIDTQMPTTDGLNTETGMVVGTTRYMSPEQARGQKVDARSDIFSLGTVLYEMVTGCAPFEGATTNDVIVSLLSKEPPPLTHSSPDVPFELERIVTKALVKDRDGRYQAIKDLLADLRALRQELEIRSKKPGVAPGGVAGPDRRSSAQYLFSKIKRHKAGFGLGMAAFVVAIAGLSYWTTTGKTIDSLAVLPFVNVNADSKTDYLADGIPESIINSLSQLPHLKVMSRNSVFRFKGQVDAKDVRQKLGVRAVLTGRVEQRGDGLAINIDLIDARDNSEIWGQRYNRRLTDVFALQEDMAKEISEKLRLKLTGAEPQHLAKRPTENLRAYQYYLQGQLYHNHRTREDVLTAIRYYEKAIEEDQNYALAHAGLSMAYSSLGNYSYIAPQEGRRKAEEAARRALTLDDNLAEAHAALGLAYVWFDPPLGERELRRAIELSPSLAAAHNFLGSSFIRQGHPDEARDEYLKARELDPLSSIIARNVALPYYVKRDYARALELVRQANSLGPPFTSSWEVEAFIQSKLLDEALEELQKAERERKNDPILIHSKGLVYAARGERSEALRIINQLEGMPDAKLYQMWIAKVYSALNEKEMALMWLDRGLAAGAIGFFLKDDPVWDPIRSDSRFAGLLRRMEITP